MSLIFLVVLITSLAILSEAKNLIPLNVHNLLLFIKSILKFHYMTKSIFMFVLFFGMTYSFPQNVYINPGIKLGYMFGEKGGFVLGVELSVTKEFPNNYKLWGLVIDFDESKSLDKIHLGLESSMYVVGIDAGPTFAWDNEGNYLGFSLIPFSGAILIPYYEFTFLNKDKLFSEIGSYIKVTIPNKNNSFSFGPE